MTRLPTLLLAFVTLVLALGASSADAQNRAAPAAAKQYLEQRHARLDRLLDRPANAQRDAQLGRLLDDLIAFDALAEASMGTHWADLSASQRSDFSEVLKQLVERSYRSNLERIKDYDVTYGDAAHRGTSVFVSTQARSTENRRAPAVTIDYEMKIVNDEWRAVNVVTDGQSLVENYRSQFHTLIERDGFDGLMERMRGRLNG